MDFKKCIKPFNEWLNLKFRVKLAFEFHSFLRKENAVPGWCKTIVSFLLRLTKGSYSQYWKDFLQNLNVVYLRWQIENIWFWIVFVWIAFEPSSSFCSVSNAKWFKQPNGIEFEPLRIFSSYLVPCSFITGLIWNVSKTDPWSKPLVVLVRFAVKNMKAAVVGNKNKLAVCLVFRLVTVLFSKHFFSFVNGPFSNFAEKNHQ